MQDRLYFERGVANSSFSHERAVAPAPLRALEDGKALSDGGNYFGTTPGCNATSASQESTAADAVEQQMR